MLLEAKKKTPLLVEIPKGKEDRFLALKKKKEI